MNNSGVVYAIDIQKNLFGSDKVRGDKTTFVQCGHYLGGH